MFAFIFRQIPWQSALVFVGLLSLLISMTLTYISRRFLHKYQEFLEREIHIKTIDVTAIILGLLLGFTTLVSQNWYDFINSAVETEANLIQSGIQNAEFFSSDDKQKIREAYKEYVHYLLTYEWKALEEGDFEGRTVVPYIEKIENVYLNTAVNTDKQKIAYTIALTNLAAINKERVRFEQLASSHFHPIIWILIWFFALILVCFITTYPIRNAVYNYIISFTYIWIIGFLILFLHLLEYPFSGDIRVKPKALTEIMERNFTQ